ncbi:MAG: rhodanese-like domain-containing protein [Blastocatellia bacterium]
MNMILKLGAGALIAGMAIAAAGCAKSGAPTHTADAATGPAPQAHSAASIPSHPQHTEDKTPRINVEEAKKLVAEGKAIIIDVRGPDAYKMSHIKGALDVPVSKLETGNLNLEDLPKDKLIIAYCA